MVVPFNIPNANAQGFQFVQILTSTCYLLLFSKVLIFMGYFVFVVVVVGFKSSLYILEVSPIRYMICKCFLPFCKLPFLSVDCIL